LKLAYFVNTYPSGSQTFIRREINALERQGWEVHRFALRSGRDGLVHAGDISEDGLTEHLLEIPRFRLLRSGFGWMARHPQGAWRAFKLALHCARFGTRGVAGTGGVLKHLIYLCEAAHFARRCADLRLPHAHAHFGTNSTIVVMLAAQMGGPGYSFTVHGPEEFDAPRALSLGLKADLARFTVAISHFGRSQLCRWAKIKTWPHLHVVHCGIEPWRFPDPAPLPQGGPQLVAIGRLSEQKGFDLLLEAVKVAQKKLPDIKLTIVGEGPLRPRIEATIAQYKLQDHVQLDGWMDEAQVRDALAKAQALVLPSFAEGLPVVLMEAMAAGRPVIATSVAGVPELVTAEVGWLVPAGDAEALADAILNLSATPYEQLTHMGASARARVFQRHNIDTEAEKLTMLFASRGNP